MRDDIGGQRGPGARSGLAVNAVAADSSPTSAAGQSNFLARLAPQDHADFVALARTETIPKHRMIFRSGEASAHVYVLKRGLVKIYDMSDLGRDTILWFCLSGEIFGLAEAVAGGFRGVSAQACENSEVLAIHSDQFRQFLAVHPQAALLSLQALSSRLRGLGHVLVNFVSDDVHTRIGKLLLRLVARYGNRVGGEIVLKIPLTHQAIADMVGASRPTVSNALGDLKRRGVLSIDGQHIRIENSERLHELAKS